MFRNIMVVFYYLISCAIKVQFMYWQVFKISTKKINKLLFLIFLHKLGFDNEIHLLLTYLIIQKPKLVNLTYFLKNR